MICTVVRYVAFIETLLVVILCESGPFFMIEPSAVFANTGEMVEFECAAFGSPAPRIVWYKDSSRIRIKGGHMREEVIAYNHRKLRISGVRYEVDSGFYSCEADNKAGAIRSRKAKLQAPFLLKDRDYFVRVPDPSYTSAPGSGTVIPCQYQDSASWPAAQIFWRKLIDNQRFENIGPSESRFISQNGTLVIAQTRPEDSGTYRCAARNMKIGTIAESDKTKLTVESGSLKPYEAEIHVARPLQSVVRRESAVLECIPYGYPPPSIIWSREGGDIPLKASQSENTFRLTIPAFSEDDQGKYFCSALQDGVVIVQMPLILNLLEAPEFLQPNQNLTITEGGELTIPCDCRGTPTPSVLWYKNTQPLTTNINDDFSLTITGGNAITSGMYQCLATNVVGNAQATFAVKVVGPARILSELQPKTVPQGTNVTLTCEAKGSPAPSIVWRKDNKNLPSDRRITHHENLYESTIYISDVQISDNGDYKCIALNENGDDSMTTTISVEGPPFINIEPKDTVGITGSNILVRCGATASPVPSILWYRNELKLIPSTKYQFTEEGLLIKNARAVDGGSFMCQAYNSLKTVSSSPVQVTVYNVPQITHELPPATNVTAGKTGLLLQCGITKDYSSYQWYRRGIPLLSVFYGDNVTPRIETRKGAGLYFHSVLPEDQGLYSCNVSNPAATASTAGYLYVDVMPTITLISHNTEVREYENFWLDCLFEGEPKPTMEWRHNNNPIRREHTIMSNGTLRITSANRFDSGAYQCIVTNRQGTKKKDVIVTVRSKARIENFPSIQYPITGQLSTIICEVSGYPYPAVEWQKDGMKIETYNRNGYLKQGSNLIINNPERTQHDGLYTCIASNDYGRDSGISRVEVLDAPQITHISGCGAVKAGLECKMSCEATGNPLPTLSWKYRIGNRTITASSDNKRYFVSLLDSQSKLRELAFTIKNLRASDSRIYFCHAENPAGITSRSLDLRVRFASVIVQPPLLNYEFPIGATLTMSCAATGEPAPRITWEKKGGRLPPNGRSSVDSNGSLVIQNVQTADEGAYTCIADNNNDNAGFEFPTDTKTTTVKVTSNDPLTVMDNPVETWLIIVIVICVLVVCIVVFVSIKMVRDKSREKRSYKPPTAMTKPDEPSYQYETVTPKPVMFQVPIDTSNSLPMYNLRTLSWDNKHPNSFKSQFDDVDKQLQGLLNDLDNNHPKAIDNLESDI